MSEFKLSVFSPERRLIEAAVITDVTLPAHRGQIQILAGHAATMGILTTGVFSYHLANGTEHTGVISTGFFEVKDDHVIVLAETLELQAEIDVNRARTAQQKAESALQSPELDEASFRKYELKLQRSLIRQQLASRS